MSKQYMDFAPRKVTGTRATAGVKAAVGVKPETKQRSGAKTASAKPTVRRTGVGVASAKPVARRPGMAAKRPVTRAKQPEPKAASGTAGRSGSFSVKKEPVLGVIEDLNPKFVNTNVPKRPLSQAPHFRTQKTEVAAAKAMRVGVRGVNSAEKSTDKPKKTGANGVYSTPKSPFINQAKVQKRPLSKNVYQKKVITPKEEPKGPVTIISKPESQAHVGLIVTIILTIILGAAAGTVAFLLLPK